jgi:EAL domain-containing protein (putative c-di-GMP-specific phosphodiesterase class I)
MYLLLNEKEKIVLNTVKEFAEYNLSNYKVYSLAPVDYSILVNDGQIRDEISRILKKQEMTKDDLLQKVNERLEISKSRISKVITAMKKEGTIFVLDDLDYMGNKLLGME